MFQYEPRGEDGHETWFDPSRAERQLTARVRELEGALRAARARGAEWKSWAELHEAREQELVRKLQALPPGLLDQPYGRDPGVVAMRVIETLREDRRKLVAALRVAMRECGYCHGRGYVGVAGHVCLGDSEVCARRCPEVHQEACDLCYHLGFAVGANGLDLGDPEPLSPLPEMERPFPQILGERRFMIGGSDGIE